MTDWQGVELMPYRCRDCLTLAGSKALIAFWGGGIDTYIVESC